MFSVLTLTDGFFGKITSDFESLPNLPDKGSSLTMKQNWFSTTQRHSFLSSWSIIFFVLLAACASTATLPAQVIEEYYQALTKGDLNTMIALACPEWEEQARNEYNSFSAVTAELEGLQCKTISQEKTSAIVGCEGKVVANYGNEVLEIDLSKLTFQLVQQDGNWRFCGYP